jgi:hypothetical protein
MRMPSSAEVAAALRHGGSYAGGILTAFTVIGVLPADQASAAVADIQQIVDHLAAAFGAFSNLIVIIGPAFTLLFAKVAATSASLRSQLTSISSNKDVKIRGEIQVPPAIAAAVPSPQVVSNAK